MKMLLTPPNDALLAQQLKALERCPPSHNYSPISDYLIAKTTQDKSRGQQLIREGRVGCLIVAGGHGSRLGFPGPKGCFPIGQISHKTLFQYFAEKVVAASKQAGCELKLAIMTSQENHEATIAHFKAHHNFGLKAEQLTFFSQGELPYLNNNHHRIQNTNGVEMSGPDGNGHCFKYLIESGIYDQWRRAGIDYLNLVMVDNPLADPFDAALIDYHAFHGGDITLKSVLREDPKEKVGLIVEREGKVAVIEYGEIPEPEASTVNKKGDLHYSYANLSLFCLTMDFIWRCQKEMLWDLMPLHASYKKLPSGPFAWKFERYIFDLLPWAEGARVMIYPRTSCFAPLKDLLGAAGVEAVQEALLKADRLTYKQISGREAPEGVKFELAPQFYYPTEELLEYWRGRLLPQQPSYITADIPEH